MIITKQEAKNLGSKHYFTGKPCKYGHIAKRFVSRGQCLECNRVAALKIAQNNPEKNCQKAKEWRNNNLEKAKFSAAVRYQKNKKTNLEYILFKKREWIKANKDKANASTAKHRASKAKRTPAWLTPIDYERIQNEYKLAEILRKITGQQWHVDHIIPMRGKMVSGLHVPSNLRVVLAKENMAKSNKFEVVL